jgi:hypothetical protein
MKATGSSSPGMCCNGTTRFLPGCVGGCTPVITILRIFIDYVINKTGEAEAVFPVLSGMDFMEEALLTSFFSGLFIHIPTLLKEYVIKIITV